MDRGHIVGRIEPGRDSDRCRSGNQYAYGFAALTAGVVALAWPRLPRWGRGVAWRQEMKSVRGTRYVAAPRVPEGVGQDVKEFRR